MSDEPLLAAASIGEHIERAIAGAQLEHAGAFHLCAILEIGEREFCNWSAGK